MHHKDQEILVLKHLSVCYGDVYSKNLRTLRTFFVCSTNFNSLINFSVRSILKSLLFFVVVFFYDILNHHRNLYVLILILTSVKSLRILPTNFFLHQSQVSFVPMHFLDQYQMPLHQQSLNQLFL
eukprot:UN34059